MKKNYVCKACAAQFTKWQGQCPSCKEWNVLEEGISVSTRSASKSASASELVFKPLKEVKIQEFSRISTGMGEVDRVLGGGIVPAEVLLLAGNPGAGKSTLLLQVLSNLSKKYKVFYVSGEESEEQIAIRAHRLALENMDIPIIFENDANNIIAFMERNDVDLIVVDSIQVMLDKELSNSAGSLVQVREIANKIINVAKKRRIAVIFIGHVTKDGQIAGPKVLEHSVDCSLLLDNMLDQRYRIIRATKNRFGDINEIGVLAMTELGLKEVKNPSAIFLSEYKETANLSGNVVSVIMHGNRPMMIEIQALVEDTTFSYPKVLSIGYDQNRLSMLLATASRSLDIPLNKKNIYLNIVGGLSVEDTSIDLPIIAAILSSHLNTPLQEMALIGEVGLSGEVRPIQFGQERIKEAIRQNFKKIFVPQKNLIKPVSGAFALKNIFELLKILKK